MATSSAPVPSLYTKVSELFWLCFTIISIAVVLKIVITIVYNVYFHPLRKFPGPWFAKASHIPYVRRMLNGRMIEWSTELHLKYGNAVRVAPDEIEFTDPSAWKTIHQARPELARPAFGQGSVIAPNGVRPIACIVNAEDHARQRRILNHGFSERALQEQEDILQGYVDLFVKGIRKESEAGHSVNMGNWFMFLTVDIISDLCFGESFLSLQKGKHNPWMQTVFDGLKIAGFLTAFDFFEPMGTILSYITPDSIKWQLQKPLRLHFGEIQELVDHRITSGVKRPDIMQFILENNSHSGMSRGEIESTINLAMIAGSDTSATTLTGTIWYLLHNPEKLDRLVKEIRSSFKSSKDITSVNAGQLEYLSVVLRESLRLYQPSPISLPKWVDRPMEIAGWHVPAGVRVGIPHRASNLMPWNFVEADSWIPERWLPDPDPKFAADKRDMSQPFLVGSRNCPGQNLAWTEMRLAMCKLLWNFDVELSKDTSENWLDQKVYLIPKKGPLYVNLKSTGLP